MQSVHAPFLLHIYTADKQILPDTHRLRNADDLCIGTGATSFQKYETHLTATLYIMQYQHQKWSPNPSLPKTQVCTFYLTDRESLENLRSFSVEKTLNTIQLNLLGSDVG